jgi:VWFA-related protein
MAMEQLAADTGGKAFFNTNDLNAAMMHAIENGSHYYTLVYTPTNKKMAGAYRKIEVKTTVGKYNLSYRRGYNADDSTPFTQTGICCEVR